MKKILFGSLFAAAGLLAASCEEDILRDANETYVTLNADNTYLAGDEVKFTINGNPDYVYMYTGEVKSQYEYRNRTVISMEDLETCKLKLSITALYGNAGALDIYGSKTFQGLKGNDGVADRATMLGIQSAMDESKNIEGWTKLPYNEATTAEQFVDITDFADNFSLAFHWNCATSAATQRTYRVNYSFITKFKDRDEIESTGKSIEMTSVSMNTELDPYHKNNSNGSVIFNNKDWDFMMQGAGADVLSYALNSWVVTTPRPLNNVSPDKGISVKSLADDISQYGYVYTKAGTYEAVFVLTDGNYQGTSRKVQKMKITIVDPIGMPQ